MNYWPAQPTNLSPCHFADVEYVKSLVPRGRCTAPALLSVRMENLYGVG